MKIIKAEHQNRLRKRTLLYGVFFSLLFSSIGVKAFYLQVCQRDWLAEKAAGQYERSFQSSGKRGTIFDRNQREMAVSLETNSVAVHPLKIRDPKSAALKLSRVLGTDYKTLHESLSARKPFVWIKRQISPKQEKEIKDLAIEGVIFPPGSSRFYPNKTLAGQLLGFTGIDGNGLDGIEYSFDADLKGKAINLTVMKDALGRRFEAGEDNNLNGNSLVLSIDSKIQYVAERALSEGVQAHSGKSGIALVMDVKTGGLLAMAHYPFFNPNSYRQYGRGNDAVRIRAITDPFEPGSTIKIFSAAAAIDSELCTADTLFFCENGSYKVGRNVIHDSGSHSYGWLTLSEIIKYSSNIGAVKIKDQIGAERLYNELTDFGFGKKTRIDLIGESPGLLSNYKRWKPIDAGTISFGQGISVSALQLVTGVSAIANDGVLMKPAIVVRVIDPTGRTVKEITPQPVKKVISVKSALAIKDILKTVMTEDGTGTNGIVEGYAVCGKTGTAQKIGPDGAYEKSKYVSSFVGFLPADNPVVTILVIVDEPEGQYYGGSVAAPIFKNIAHEVLYYLNIPPTQEYDKYRVSVQKGLNG